ncbi:MAG: methyltransferase domain-containing protein [Candidatus Sulfotelmatobacter sp.]
MNRLRHHWQLLGLVGPRYPVLLLKALAFGRGCSSGSLSRFVGCGLEIGGPSQFFQSGREFPIYSAARNVDNVNYSKKTFWEGTLQEGKCFKYDPDKDAGQQFICEASDLSPIQNGTYDFIASCHTLEHCANPLKALYEWRRTLKDEGWLALVLPHKSGTFDHRRAVTRFQHILEDYNRDMGEDDTTHFEDILQNHDLERDPGQSSQKALHEWITNNSVNRGAHHHVFDAELALTLVDYAGFEVVSAEVLMPYHILVIAQKSARTSAQKAPALLRILQRCSAASPFRLDRQKNHNADGDRQDATVPLSTLGNH